MRDASACGGRWLLQVFGSHGSGNGIILPATKLKSNSEERKKPGCINTSDSAGRVKLLEEGYTESTGLKLLMSRN